MVYHKKNSFKETNSRNLITV